MPLPKPPKREDILYVLNNIPSNTRQSPVENVTAFLWAAYEEASRMSRSRKVTLAALRTHTASKDLLRIYRECKREGVKRLTIGHHELTGFFVIGEDEDTGGDKLYGADDNGVHVE